MAQPSLIDKDGRFVPYLGEMSDAWRELYDGVEQTCAELEAAEATAKEKRSAVSEAVESIAVARRYIAEEYGTTDAGQKFHAEWLRMRAARQRELGR